MTARVKRINPLKCERCPRVFREALPDAKQWNATMKRGILVGSLCPNCQTPEENAEAEINQATTTYSTDAFGRLIGTMKEAS